MRTNVLTAVLIALLPLLALRAEDDLVLAGPGVATATVVVAADAGVWERKAAEDLARVIGLMTGQVLVVAATASGPRLVVGRAALAAEPRLGQALVRVGKPEPVVRADAIALLRIGDAVLIAGSNDESHYFAAAELMRRWGCRWYLPGEIGECIPRRERLVVGALEHAYAPPFEIRHYWLSWNAAGPGAEEFRRRNFMTETSLAGMGHALGHHTQAVVPPGGSVFNVPLGDEATAAAVVASIEKDYAAGVPGISLAIEDGDYVNDSAEDRELQAGMYDKYTLKASQTDAMMTLYNRVARTLREKHPDSPTVIGGMAYANVTLPPQRVREIEPNVVMWLAPIDIDPIHGIDDPLSPPKQEYGAMMRRWAALMSGRLVIYDYDQGQLVWRDLPCPSHLGAVRDIRAYRDAGILGVGTESRGATATTFLNLHIRGQLMWDPDADVDALIAEFYPAFYGPAAEPMAAYWNAIFAAWRDTIVTEHEYFIAPAIYTPALVAELGAHLALAEAIIAPTPTADQPVERRRLAERMRLARLGYDVITAYAAMVEAAAGGCDYRAAVAAGERSLKTRDALTDIDPTFTTYRNIGENGPAWWPGEVQQMRDLAALTDGTKGTMIATLPREWALRRDPHDTGVARGWYDEKPDLSPWNERGAALSAARRKDWGGEWEMARSDLYLQAQGIRHADGQSFTGHYWYRTDVELDSTQAAAPARLVFPGLFNECWLYVNGVLVAHRAFSDPWWRNDYAFTWDVDVAAHLRPGANAIVLRGLCRHHFAGMFRRPFLYRPVAP